MRALRHPAVWLPISIALLAFVIWRSRLWEAGDRLGHVELVIVAVALVVGQAIPLLWALRSADLLAAAGRPVPVRPLVPMTVFANTINNLTPGSMGELVRLWLLRAHHDVDYGTGGAVILIERIVAIGYLSGSAAVLWLADALAWPWPVPAVLLVALTVSPGVFYALGFRPSALVAALPLGGVLGDRWVTLADALGRVDRTIATVLTHPVRLLMFAFITGSIFAISTLQLWLVARSLGIDLPAAGAWGALGLATTAGVLSFLPFGLGATDLVLVALLGAMGVAGPSAATIAFGYRLVSTVPFALEGVLSYAWLSAALPARGVGASMRAAADDLARDPPSGGG
jgi:glycosyltransferase 2 family protein